MSDCSGPILRNLIATDIPAAVILSEQAGWNQTDEDWRLLIELAPEGCFAIEVNGEVAATTTLLCYGRRLAWIGMVLTSASYRGRGFARRLLTKALKQADQLRIETVKLDATDQGRPIYEKMGFRFEQEVERWSRSGSGNSSGIEVAIKVPATPNWQVADGDAFGIERFELLQRLARRGSSLFIENSYLLTRPGRQTEYLGPAVCDSHRIARVLAERALQTVPCRGWSWDLFPRNTNAVVIARELEFAPTRHLQRLVRGRDLLIREQSIYAIAGFELG